MGIKKFYEEHGDSIKVFGAAVMSGVLCGAFMWKVGQRNGIKRGIYTMIGCVYADIDGTAWMVEKLIEPASEQTKRALIKTGNEIVNKVAPMGAK